MGRFAGSRRARRFTASTLSAAACALANGYQNLHLAIPYIASFPSGSASVTGDFGSSIGYKPSVTTVTGQTLYFSATGSAGNDGLTHLTPKNFGSLPTSGGIAYTGAANTKYLIRAGDTLPLLQAEGRGIILSTANTVYAAYDGNPSSPTYGQEITDYLDPWFSSLYAGYYPTLAYKQSKYFIVDGGIAIEQASTPDSNGVPGVTFNGSANVNTTIKGAWIKNFRHSGVTFQNNTGGRILSCIIEDICRSPLFKATAPGDQYPGNGIRCEDAPDSIFAPGYTIAGNWMRGINGDCIWAGYSGIQNLTLMNNVVSTAMRRYSYESDHGDAFQTVGPLEGAIIRENVFDIAAHPRYHPMEDYVFQGLIKQIAAFRNNGTLGTSTVLPIIEDNVMVSDQTAIQYTGNGNGNFIYRRNLALTNSSQFVTSSIAPVRWENGAVMQDCISVLIKNSNPATAAVSASGVLTEQNCQKIVIAGSTNGVRFTSRPVITTATPQVGTPVAFTSGVATGQVTPAISIQWMRETTGGVFSEIPGATGATYTPVTGDDQFKLRVRQDAIINNDLTQMASIMSLGVSVLP